MGAQAPPVLTTMLLHADDPPEARPGPLVPAILFVLFAAALAFFYYHGARGQGVLGLDAGAASIAARVALLAMLATGAWAGWRARRRPAPAK